MPGATLPLRLQSQLTETGPGKEKGNEVAGDRQSLSGQWVNAGTWCATALKATWDAGLVWVWKNTGLPIASIMFLSS